MTRLKQSWQHMVLAGSIFLFGTAASAQVVVKEPWARATVAEQKASGAFMQLTSPNDAKLVEVRSSAAKVVEVHEMKMDNNVMRMRAIPSLALPAGKTVELRPGGYHVMLIDLNQQLKEGESVPLTLVIENSDGKRQNVDVSVPIRSMRARPVDNSHHKH